MITRSHNVTILCRGNVKQNDLISALMRSKTSMAEIASNREPEDSHPSFFPTEEINEYHISTTGAKITTDSSISVLYQYCDKLPKDKYGDYVSILLLYMAIHSKKNLPYKVFVWCFSFLFLCKILTQFFLTFLLMLKVLHPKTHVSVHPLWWWLWVHSNITI